MSLTEMRWEGVDELEGCYEQRNERSCLAEEPSFSIRGLLRGVNIGSAALDATGNINYAALV
jgi:hypothetical protein